MNKITWSEFLDTLEPVDREEKIIAGQNFSEIEILPTDDISGYCFDDCDFRGCKLTREQFLSVAGGQNTKFPEQVKDFSAEDFVKLSQICSECKWPALNVQSHDNFTNADFSDQDISSWTGLEIGHLKQSKRYWNCITPAIAVSQADSFEDLPIEDLDISHWKGVTVKHLNETPSIMGAKLPKMDLAELKMDGRNFCGVDFGDCWNLKWQECIKSKDLAHAKLPKMRIPMAEERYWEDTPENQQAFNEKRMPKKTVEKYLDFGTTDIYGTDFSKVQGLTTQQVEAIVARHGANAKIEISQEAEIQAAAKQKKIGEMALEIAQIISPMPQVTEKTKYRMPTWLNGIAYGMAYFCYENKFDARAMSEILANSDPEVVSAGFAEIQKNWRIAKSQGLTPKEFAASGYIGKAAEIPR